MQLSYIVYVKSGDSGIKVLNTHVLFEHAGKWGELHASVVKPSTEEIAMLLGLGDAFRVVNPQ